MGVHVKRNDEMKNQPQRGSIQQCQIKPNNDDTTRQTNCLHKMATGIKNIINRSFALAETSNKINHHATRFEITGQTQMFGSGSN